MSDDQHVVARTPHVPLTEVAKSLCVSRWEQAACAFCV